MRKNGGKFVLAGMLLVLGCPRSFALNPALDISQYAHTAWRVREGFAKGRISSVAQTPDGYLWVGTDEIYRITREALRNAFRHAGARHIETEITYGERTLRLRIRDDGKGIPPEVLETGRRGHYGLSGMRERAKQFGGKLDIWNRPGAGAEIELSVTGAIAYRAPVRRSLFALFRAQPGGRKRDAL